MHSANRRQSAHPTMLWEQRVVGSNPATPNVVNHSKFKAKLGSTLLRYFGDLLAQICPEFPHKLSRYVGKTWEKVPAFPASVRETFGRQNQSNKRREAHSTFLTAALLDSENRTLTLKPHRQRPSPETYVLAIILALFLLTLWGVP